MTKPNFNKFYSSNYNLLKYIDLDFYKKFQIVEPFYGGGDLVKCFDNVEKYDISPDFDDVIKRDTLKNPPDYSNKIVITNPPYSAKNQLSAEIKSLYSEELKNVNDLYQIHIEHLINNPCLGGIEILPSNFMFGDKTRKLRTRFFEIYYIKLVNIYEYKVFEHTTQSVITIEFLNKNNFDKPKLIFNLFKSENNILENIKPKNLLLNVKPSKNIKRFYNIKDNEFIPSHMIIRLLDYNMKAEYSETINEDKFSDRSIMTICFKELPTDINNVIEQFNDKLKEIREKSYSLNLSSYREFDRKRLSFEQVAQIFTLIGY